MSSLASAQVLVVLPCLNEEAHVGVLLGQLLAANPQPHFKFIVVDGGSADRTTQIAADFAAKHNNVHILQNPKRIQSAAVNLAVATYGKDADYLIRIDVHAEYPSDYCEVLLAEAERTKADSVVVSMLTQGKSWFQRAVAAAQNSRLGNGGSAHRLVSGGGKWIDHGHHALMRIAAFRDARGYDENFRSNEDAELDMRLRQKNYKIWLTGKTMLIYYPRSTVVGLLRQYFSYGFGRASTLLKHNARPKIRQMLPVMVAPVALLACLTPLLSLAILPFAAWCLLCLAYGALPALRAHDAGLLMAGPAAMLMHFGWSLGFWKALLTNRKRA